MAGVYERLKSALLFGDQISEITPPEPIIEGGVLDTDSVGLIYGGSGIGKSFLAMDWGLCVVHGLEWNGHKVKQGHVLYVVAEGAAGTGPRVEAWKEHRGIDTIEDIAWLPLAANILDRESREALIRIAEEQQPLFTILDTVARHIPGGDENSSQVMSMVVETLDAIKAVTGGCAIGVHHAGKDLAAGSRGHTSLRGALDHEFECTGSKVKGVQHVTVKVTKQKNHEDGYTLARLRLEKVANSRVLVDDSDTPVGQTLTPKELEALAALAETNGRGLSFSEWKSASGLPATTFERIRTKLLAMGLIASIGSEEHPRYEVYPRTPILPPSDGRG